jgi:hypothetical protein
MNAPRPICGSMPSIALIGSVLPNAASYEAVRHLPSGVVSILLSLVPMFALPIALCWGLERFAALRALGVCWVRCGGADRRARGQPARSGSMAGVLPLAMIAPPSTGSRAMWSPATARDMGPVQLLLGAALVGLPMARRWRCCDRAMGRVRVRPGGAPERALVACRV